jgi:hypothetical protein
MPELDLVDMLEKASPEVFKESNEKQSPWKQEGPELERPIYLKPAQVSVGR